jgi:putative transposase
LSGADEVVLSLYAKGLTTAEISADVAEISGASVSRETVSRITDQVIEETNDWPAAGPGVCGGVHRRRRCSSTRSWTRSATGRSPTGRSTPRSASPLTARRDVLGLWAGTVGSGEGAKFWMSMLTDLRNRDVKDVFFLVCNGLKACPKSW